MNLPSWINWTNFFSAWGVLWALATACQNSKTPRVYKVSHFILGISPGDFVKALKALGTNFIPPTMAILFFVLAGVSACSASKGVPPASTTEEAAIFGSQLNLCEQTAHSHAEAMACRAGVEEFWCGPKGGLSSSAGCDHSDGGANDAR